MHFNELRLITPLLKAVEAEGYTTPSPIQRQAIPPVLEGRDVLGIAQTGTGKTAAFALPILQRLFQNPPVERAAEHLNQQQGRGGSHPHRRGVARSARAIRALVLAPTRELATQIAESFRTYGKQTGLRTAVVFGGVGAGAQIREMQSGPDVLVACPGRLLDLISQRHIFLGSIEVLVLDEADRMLDMGFAPDIRRVLTHVPARRQTLLFSATMPAEIQKMVNELLHDPIRVEVAPVATPAERVQHTTYFVGKNNKPALLQHLLTSKTDGLPGNETRRVLVFARTKRGADRVAERLSRAGIRSEAIHGNKSQGQRERALESFRRGASPVMVATDLAARGLDVDAISHVINFDLPNEPETFVHRIGRTARAGASGYAISFCDADEGEYLADIEHLIQQALPKEHAHPHHCPDAHASHALHRDRRANKQISGGMRIALKSQPRHNAPRQTTERPAGAKGQISKQQRSISAKQRFDPAQPRAAEPAQRSGKRNARPGRNDGRQPVSNASDAGRRKSYSDSPRHHTDARTPSFGQARVIRSARWNDED
ncbi:MAG: DEAD/DEAH box helicase [Candidatus Sumerlaeaceae bacterium]